MSDKGIKLLAQMRNSPHNWKRRDLDALYESFGFEIMHGRSHDIVKHPEFPALRTTLARHNYVVIGYIRTAIKLVDELRSLRGPDEQLPEDKNEPKP